VFIVTLSLAENSEDAKKIKLAAENPEDLWKMKQMKSLKDQHRRPREELLEGK
jgi:stalled ribosome rescue protein Dom34